MTAFRDMRRIRQLLPEAEAIDILERCTHGVLAVLGDEGYPYAVPLSYCYVEGKLLFHGANVGHKLDALAACDKASFCVCDQGYRREGEWALNIKSVIVFGRIRLVEDHDKAMEITRKLSYKYTSDSAYIENEIKKAGPGTLCFALEIEHMTGKLVNES